MEEVVAALLIGVGVFWLAHRAAVSASAPPSPPVVGTEAVGTNPTTQEPVLVSTQVPVVNLFGGSGKVGDPNQIVGK